MSIDRNMRQPDLGQEYRLAILRDSTESGDAFAVIRMAQQQGIEAPVLTLLEPVCEYGGSILDVLVRQGICSQAQVDEVLQTCRADGRPLCVSFALANVILRAMLVGTGNLHMSQLLDRLIEGGLLRPAVIAAGNGITVCGYDPGATQKPQPADLERARRQARGRRRRSHD